MSMNGQRANVTGVHARRFRRSAPRRLLAAMRLPVVAALLGHGRYDTMRISSQSDEAALVWAATVLEAT